MKTQGIGAVQLETHDLRASIEFFEQLGFALEFERDNAAALLRCETGPYVLVAVVPAEQTPGLRIMVELTAIDAFSPSDALGATGSFRRTHWDTQELELHDPDGRAWTLEAPLAA